MRAREGGERANAGCGGWGGGGLRTDLGEKYCFPHRAPQGGASVLAWKFSISGRRRGEEGGGEGCEGDARGMRGGCGPCTCAHSVAGASMCPRHPPLGSSPVRAGPPGTRCNDGRPTASPGRTGCRPQSPAGGGGGAGGQQGEDTSAAPGSAKRHLATSERVHSAQ